MAEAGQAPAERRDKPWIFRTYAGTTARESNRLYRQNLEGYVRSPVRG